jgi:hypothetical protein
MTVICLYCNKSHDIILGSMEESKIFVVKLLYTNTKTCFCDKFCYDEYNKNSRRPRRNSNTSINTRLEHNSDVNRNTKNNLNRNTKNNLNRNSDQDKKRRFIEKQMKM